MDTTKDGVRAAAEAETKRRQGGATHAADGAMAALMHEGAAERVNEVTFLGAWLWLRLAGKVSFFTGEKGGAQEV